MPRSGFRSVLALSVLFTVLLFAGLSARGEVHVPLEGQAVMAGNSGAFSYSIPIQVPPGRNSLAPQLALTYNSRMGNGFLGVGWSLSIGHVMRNTKQGLDYNCDPYTSATPCFIYMLGGSSSELIPRTDWCSDCYGAKIEGAFTRFRYVNGQYWEATDKGGTKYLLGQTTASRQDNPNNSTEVFKWELDSVTDTHGNSIDYSYFKENGQIYINEINYQNNHIEFGRESREVSSKSV